MLIQYMLRVYTKGLLRVYTLSIHILTESEYTILRRVYYTLSIVDIHIR